MVWVPRRMHAKTFFPGMFYVKTKWIGLWILLNKNFFRKHKYAFPMILKIKYFQTTKWKVWMWHCLLSYFNGSQSCMHDFGSQTNFNSWLWNFAVLRSQNIINRQWSLISTKITFSYKIWYVNWTYVAHKPKIRGAQ